MERLIRRAAVVAALVWSLPARAKPPPLPAWQQEMLDARPKTRASVHRSAFPEDPVLRAAGATLARPPPASAATPVVVGMTTTPTRIAHIEPALRSLLNQTQPCAVVVNVPALYNSRRSHWNGKRIGAPPWLRALDAAARATGGPCAPCVLLRGRRRRDTPAPSRARDEVA